jgi:hypothetical protein
MPTYGVYRRNVRQGQSTWTQVNEVEAKTGAAAIRKSKAEARRRGNYSSFPGDKYKAVKINRNPPRVKKGKWIKASAVRVVGNRLEIKRMVKKTPTRRNVRRSVKRQESEARWQYYGAQHGKRLDKRIAAGKKLSQRAMRSQGR